MKNKTQLYKTDKIAYVECEPEYAAGYAVHECGRGAGIYIVLVNDVKLYCVTQLDDDGCILLTEEISVKQAEELLKDDSVLN